MQTDETSNIEPNRVSFDCNGGSPPTLDFEAMSKSLDTLIPIASQRYHQLVLLVAPLTSNASAFLAAFAVGREYPFLNISLVLSRKLLDYSRQERISNALPVLESLLVPNCANVTTLAQS